MEELRLIISLLCSGWFIRKAYKLWVAMVLELLHNGLQRCSRVCVVDVSLMFGLRHSLNERWSLIARPCRHEKMDEHIIPFLASICEFIALPLEDLNCRWYLKLAQRYLVSPLEHASGMVKAGREKNVVMVKQEQCVMVAERGPVGQEGTKAVERGESLSMGQGDNVADKMDGWGRKKRQKVSCWALLWLIILGSWSLLEREALLLDSLGHHSLGCKANSLLWEHREGERRLSTSWSRDTDQNKVSVGIAEIDSKSRSIDTALNLGGTVCSCSMNFSVMSCLFYILSLT